MLHANCTFTCLLLALYRGTPPDPPAEIIPSVAPALSCRLALRTLLLHNQLVIRCSPAAARTSPHWRWPHLTHQLPAPLGIQVKDRSAWIACPY